MKKGARVVRDERESLVRDAYRDALLLCVRAMDGDMAAFARLRERAGLRPTTSRRP